MSGPDLTLVRHAAVAAALVLVTLSQGDALVVGLLLAAVVWRPAALAVVLALVASSWRWGSSSLEALAGAQAVLGPAGLVGPPAAAAASWLAGLAILLAVPRVEHPTAEVRGTGGPVGASGAPNLVWWRSWRRVGGSSGPLAVTLAPNLRRGASALVVLTWGGTAAAVVAGPALGHEPWVRLGAWAVGSTIVLAVLVLCARSARASVAFDVASGAAAVAALTLATRDAPGWSSTMDRAAVGTGAAVTAAVALLVVVGSRTYVAMRDPSA